MGLKAVRVNETTATYKIENQLNFYAHIIHKIYAHNIHRDNLSGKNWNMTREIFTANKKRLLCLRKINMNNANTKEIVNEKFIRGSIHVR